MTAVLTLPDSATGARQLSRLGVVATTAAGAALGALYGVAIRAWMRLVSEEPEFTWEGTLFIVGAFTIVGGFAGLVHGGRRRGWKGLLVAVRIPATAAGIFCFVGAGALMLPTIVFGALAAARHDWPRGLRVALAVVAVAGVVPAATNVGGIPAVRMVLGLVLYLCLVAVEIRLFAEIYAPSAGRLPRWLRFLVGGAAVLAVGGVVLLTVGLFFTGS